MALHRQTLVQEVDFSLAGPQLALRVRSAAEALPFLVAQKRRLDREARIPVSTGDRSSQPIINPPTLPIPPSECSPSLTFSKASALNETLRSSLDVL